MFEVKQNEDSTQNLAGRQGGQKTVNITGLGPQSDKECWALLINICPSSFLITTGIRASPHQTFDQHQRLLCMDGLFILSCQDNFFLLDSAPHPSNMSSCMKPQKW